MLATATVSEAEASLAGQCSSDHVQFEGVQLKEASAKDLYVTTLERQLLRMSAMEQLRTCCFADPQLPAAADVDKDCLLRSALRDSVRVFLSLMLFLCLETHFLD
ncbi:hypothetical protein LSCM4_07597 [Leishmania orientalis]|uniref:Uncharacterized protein n=1 Tax=Leishmania orientalis TaxID=2249476 RepID=A0A836HYG3_9TRYP|nr:hypothetical protein LSCM4_07597 [Leishmania orientalis]